jgi:hypothetical protein
MGSALLEMPGTLSENQTGTMLNALHYLFTHDGSRVIAHCLDLDIATNGTSIEDAEESLNALVLIQIASCFAKGNFAELRFRAPFEDWQRLSGARSLETVSLEVEVPPVVLPVSRKVQVPVVRSERQAA